MGTPPTRPDDRRPQHEIRTIPPTHRSLHRRAGPRQATGWSAGAPAWETPPKPTWQTGPAQPHDWATASTPVAQPAAPAFEAAAPTAAAPAAKGTRRGRGALGTVLGTALLAAVVASGSTACDRRDRGSPQRGRLAVLELTRGRRREPVVERHDDPPAGRHHRRRRRRPRIPS